MPLSSILQKYYSFGEYFSFKTTLFIASKHLKIFVTLVFSETEVFSQYFKNILMPNGALFPPIKNIYQMN
jgi:hypothetical protein